MSPALLWLADGWRIAFLTFCGPVIGAILLLAVARLTGARWSPFERLARLAPLLLIAGAGVVLALAVQPTAPHLALWNSPFLYAARTLLALIGMAFIGSRLIRGASSGFAAIGLAIYAVMVTPIAMDWLLGGDPTHSVSSAGMMLFVEQIGGACAAMLLLRRGDERFRRDIAALLVAAALGLSYLAYMDYLIVWYGDLPARAGYYVAREDPASIGLVIAALAFGLAGPVAALSLVEGKRRSVLAGATALGGLFLFNLWWVGGGVLAACVALLSGGILLVWLLRHDRRASAHG